MRSDMKFWRKSERCELKVSTWTRSPEGSTRVKNLFSNFTEAEIQAAKIDMNSVETASMWLARTDLKTPESENLYWRGNQHGSSLPFSSRTTRHSGGGGFDASSLSDAATNFHVVSQQLLSAGRGSAAPRPSQSAVWKTSFCRRFVNGTAGTCATLSTSCLLKWRMASCACASRVSESDLPAQIQNNVTLTAGKHTVQ